uniref:4-hydroxyphenylpyruvate dioxygenase n=1 Tax=Ostreococcus mediterraneus TaxID=1486918 RepID=A0A7S0XL73_9CHLO|mmetsp:Transcript_6782/g.24701  ORF Transcript_6782/g.24701 Transcript_6782/m.24701 type:complete len:434 (-) Transcript_6782:732-2033(-)
MTSPHVTARKLVGHANFVRSNPCSDAFEVKRFHHIEFFAGDATNAASRFGVGLGMGLACKSDASTGNGAFASYVMKSNDLVFAFTAPYDVKDEFDVRARGGDSVAHPGHTCAQLREFFETHGFGARAVGLEVSDARAAFEESVKRGARAVLAPVELKHTKDDGCVKGGQIISEVELYGDVVLRFVSAVDGFDGDYLCNYVAVRDVPEVSYGLQRLDHAVGNVHELLKTVDYIANFTGFHEFAEFTAEDIGTIDSGLNSMVLANNNEFVLLPVNEPTFGTKRKSQIQTYLEQNNGPGLQHLALKTNDIFATVREMRKYSFMRGGFDFQAPASDGYYQTLKDRIGDALTDKEYALVEELGLLVDRDDQGVLIQVFTKPVSDRPTIFLEIIQRVGCMRSKENSEEKEQAAGCGGFGKGNFTELFKSIEAYEKTLEL